MIPSARASRVRAIFGLPEAAPAQPPAPGAHALDQLLRLGAGQVAYVTGPSGSGKSTLLGALRHALRLLGARVIEVAEPPAGPEAAIDLLPGPSAPWRSPGWEKRPSPCAPRAFSPRASGRAWPSRERCTARAPARGCWVMSSPGGWTPGPAPASPAGWLDGRPGPACAWCSPDRAKNSRGQSDPRSWWAPVRARHGPGPENRDERRDRP